MAILTDGLGSMLLVTGGLGGSNVVSMAIVPDPAETLFSLAATVPDPVATATTLVLQWE